MPIRKAIIPVAGLGTRFLPATKAQPKEMLTLVDKPVIQYIVEEAAEAGIEEIIFVTSIGKRAIEDHFDRNFELEYRLAQQKKEKELKEIARIGKLAKFAFVRQSKPLGDGHALLAAYPFLNKNESVAVFFGDDVIEAKKPAIKQLIEVYEKYQDPVVGVFEVPKEKISRFGVIDGIKINSSLWEVKNIVEKPSIEKAPSNLALVGRYILTPEIFQILQNQKPDRSSEIRLADALASYLKKQRVIYAKLIDGTWYDCGVKIGFLKSIISLGLKHPEVKEELKIFLRELIRQKKI